MAATDIIIQPTDQDAPSFAVAHLLGYEDDWAYARIPVEFVWDTKGEATFKIGGDGSVTPIPIFGAVTLTAVELLVQGDVRRVLSTVPLTVAPGDRVTVRWEPVSE